MERVAFAGGCFWRVIQPFDTSPGTHTVVLEYTGGYVPDPTCEQAKSQTIGHTETVEIIYDPALISYEQLVELYWRQTDPTDIFGQFEDRGDNYCPVIFYLIEEQRIIAESSKKQPVEGERFEQPIVMKIELAQPLYLTEEGH